MKTRITITKFIAIMMAFSAMAVTGSIWTTAAQQVRVMDGTTCFYHPRTVAAL